MIKTRIYIERRDYSMIAEWWQAQGNVVPDASQLDTLGVIVSDGDQDVAYICAYLSVGVGVAHLDHLVTNPACRAPMAKLRAIRALMSEILRICKDNDYQLIKAVTWSKTLSRVCQRKLGFMRVGGGFENLSVILK